MQMFMERLWKNNKKKNLTEEKYVFTRRSSYNVPIKNYEIIKKVKKIIIIIYKIIKMLLQNGIIINLMWILKLKIH